MSNVEIDEIARHPSVARARKHIRQVDGETVAEMVEIVQIPAPPYGEAQRAAWLAERFARVGLADVCTDEVGNVLGRLPGASGEAPIVVSAHLDTVFGPDTPLRVERNGKRIAAPGIADNARGLATLLALAKALRHAPLTLARPIVFLATVGEEGIGDLRGIKHVLRPGSVWRSAAGFIIIDGSGRRRIVHRAIGSRRFSATIKGVGGHSWADWGVANPVHALGLAVGRLAELHLPRQPRASLTVARVGGGTSVNAIPAEAWMEIDVRAEAASTLVELDEAVRQTIGRAVDEINAQRRRATQPLQLEVRLIGDRPTGETPANSTLVRIARAATRLIGEHPELVASSTDANVPIALGIPSIAIGAGGESGGTHTPEEWYSNEGGIEGLERALLIVVAAAWAE